MHILKKSRKMIRQFPKTDSEKIINAIRNANTVSFDIFDTLVKRSVDNPYDIFEITAFKYNHQYNGKLDLQQFQNDRKKAAIIAKQKAYEAGREEITLDEIYDCLDSTYDCIKTKIYEIEIEQEIQSCYANHSIKRVYDWCVQNRKRIIVISDMYLSIDTIYTILSNCGYKEIDRVLLSSDIGKTKRSGNLVSYLIKSESIDNAKSLIHIGDSFKSDYIEFKKRGIKSILIAKSPKFTEFSRDNRISINDKLTYRKLEGILNNMSDPNDSIYYKFGFECEGPLLYGFSCWLHKQLVSNGYEKVFFLARDGFLLQKVYDSLFKEDTIKSIYLYVSRRSVHVPLLWQFSNLKDYLLLNGEEKRWNIINIANRLGLDKNLAKSVWVKCGLKLDCTIKTKDIDKNDKILQFYETVREKSISVSKKEYTNMKLFLDSKDFKGKIAIVDSGGNATTQRCLIEYLKREHPDSEIEGFYLWCNSDNSINYKSFPISEEVVGGETVLTELPFTSPEGSTICYESDGENIVPILDEYEFEDNERVLYAIDQIQAGCIRFNEIMKRNSKYIYLNENVSYHNAMMATRYPRLKEVNIFGDFKFRSDHEDIFMAHPNKPFHYIRHPSDFRNEMKHVKWKMGFFKRLFKIPLPYYKIICFLRKI